MAKTDSVADAPRGRWRVRENECWGLPTEYKVCSECGTEYNAVFMAACCADFRDDITEFKFCPWCGKEILYPRERYNPVCDIE